MSTHPFVSLRALVLLLAGGLLACPSAGEPVPAPVCGDGALDEGEACDDGNLWGGDGCTHVCTAESGPSEVEPNDDVSEAAALGAGVDGAVLPGDRDCFSLEVAEAAAVRATVSEAGGCAGDAVLELVDADGLRITSGLPGLDGCTAIDANNDNDARYLVAGIYALCVNPIFDGAVPSYTLTAEVVDSCTDLPDLAPDPAQDLEGDGIADVCDPDDDNDGVADEEDNCPATPNGTENPFPWSTADEGFVRLWTVLGAFDEGVTPGVCEPSPDSFAGASDPDVAPILGDDVGELTWFATFSWPGASAIVNFNAWFGDVTAPREAYVASWIYSPDARDAVLAVGSDDGQVVWLNGLEAGRKTNCSGVAPDQLRFPVSLEAGWNRLLHKVYDGGGGWGVVARFYETDEETPMTDLGVSILGPMDQVDDQGDADGDGIGDICDDAP
ncbi:MAG: thrombospondin type 3 repeat-containing protein [Deltaproteobacteria bacterium]|nr:thrombospondin type 3 repeat-containing protein [Deltaproteobacteria bacterium]